MAAITIASLTMYERIGGAALQAICIGLLVLVTQVVGGLVVRTGIATPRHEIGLSE